MDLAEGLGDRRSSPGVVDPLVLLVLPGRKEKYPPDPSVGLDTRGIDAPGNFPVGEGVQKRVFVLFCCCDSSGEVALRCGWSRPWWGTASGSEDLGDRLVDSKEVVAERW